MLVIIIKTCVVVITIISLRNNNNNYVKHELSPFVILTRISNDNSFVFKKNKKQEEK